MSNKSKRLTVLLALTMSYAPFSGVAQNLRDVKPAKEKIAVKSDAARLWKEPKDIASRNLFYGPGGEEHKPGSTFTFVKEDLDGTSAKFDVEDNNGAKWKAKLGAEAQPETAATRLVWAIGYTTSETYFLPEMHPTGVIHMKRGKKWISSNGTIRNVRLKRNPEGKKEEQWEWKQNPFTGTRELNGLRVAMALVNNWDLKDVNNGVFEKKKGEGEAVYEVSDLGATFGNTGLSFPFSRSKNDLDAYKNSHFVTKVTADYVDVGSPSGPAFIYLLVKPGEYFGRIHMHWIGHRIPRADAKWVGELLGQLTPEQIHDAFRAAGYSQAEIDAFSQVIASRIMELKRL